ncbi:MAG: glycosyltransferase family 2 protein [Bacillus subtilis]|nr:glycosyltransferase family 2 protein [Bacillus subtilis]
MPVYNGEKFLRQAIESILEQTFEDFEFSIMYDHSTDKSLDIINSYSDARIKLINDGAGSLVESLNRGIDLASGEYIARMDCDDISL